MATLNDSTKAGKLATAKEIFGLFGRYAVAAVYTRFDAVQWFVWDAEISANDGKPSVIRQAFTKADAMQGLI